MSERYTIGEAAKKLQVSTRTLRFYEEKDLVRPAYTEENGYRFYSEEQIRQIELILFLKELGFSLRQIKMLIQDKHGGQSLDLLLKEQYQENQRKIDGPSVTVITENAFRENLIKLHPFISRHIFSDARRPHD